MLKVLSMKIIKSSLKITLPNILNNMLINKTNEMDVLLKQNIKEYIPNLAGYLNG